MKSSIIEEQSKIELDNVQKFEDQHELRIVTNISNNYREDYKDLIHANK